MTRSASLMNDMNVALGDVKAAAGLVFWRRAEQEERMLRSSTGTGRQWPGRQACEWWLAV